MNNTSMVSVVAAFIATVFPPNLGPNSDICNGNECFTNLAENDTTVPNNKAISTPFVEINPSPRRLPARIIPA